MNGAGHKPQGVVRKRNRAGPEAAQAHAPLPDGPRHKRDTSSRNRPKEEPENESDLEYEDFVEDEEMEEEIVESNDNDDTAAGEINAMDVEEDGKEEKEGAKTVWRPGVDVMADDEELDYDSSAYTMFHKLRMDWPCLSFDIIRDHLGEFRTKFPHTVYVAAGTQADAGKNHIKIMKWSDLHRTKHDDDESEEDEESDSDDDDLDDDPILEEKSISTDGAINRIRSMPQSSFLLASWSESGSVHIWNVLPYLQALDQPPRQALAPVQPVFAFAGHGTEGFAVDWSLCSAGRLATGDTNRQIFVWNPRESSWAVDRSPYMAHASSVEDIQWSPTEPDVFASCSADKTVRIWDARVKDRSMLFVAAHQQDVNVISWNRRAAHLLCSGSDDGSFKIWDLRNFKSNSAAAHFKWHSGPITSVEWHPIEESVLSIASADNAVTVWDMALEADVEAHAQGAAVQGVEVPAQLLFVHMGQKDVKEVHWHPQIPSTIISTAVDGMNIFKPSNMEDTIVPPK